MQITVTVIARNEAQSLPSLSKQLAAQTLFELHRDISILVVANGCTDDTAAVGRTALRDAFRGRAVNSVVHETPLGGKARAWNLAVHDLIAPSTDLAIFLDADIELARCEVLAELVDQLTRSPRARAVSGYPVKDIAKKLRKSLIDRFSLKVSSQTSAPHSINGSLYVARMDELRRIFLPVPTPGEDGLLSGMIHTNGFSRPAVLETIERAPRPTHYFEAHSIAGYFRHERRMTVGTTINGWLFELFWEEAHRSHIGSIVARRNAGEPDWVNRLVKTKVGDRAWALPPRMLTWRLHNLRGIGIARAAVRAPVSVAATLLNLWPCVQANSTLKRQGSAGYW